MMSVLSAYSDLPIHEVTLVVIRNQQLRCVRKRGTTCFMLPGGKPQSGESVLVALRVR